MTDRGYEISWSGKKVTAAAPHGRTLVFAGDLVDRGPRNADTLRIVMAADAAGCGICVRGNHDDKLLRWLLDHPINVGAALQVTIDQLAHEPPEFRREAALFLAALPSHVWLDGGDLVVCHAGIREDMIGFDCIDVTNFTMYGETTGECDQYDYPVRRDWAADYRGDAHVIYGHTTIAKPQWVNKTLCIDTGCVFGHELTALRWPERTLHSVPAEKVHYRSNRPEIASLPERENAPI